MIIKKQWNNYKKDFEYETDINFRDVCGTVLNLMDSLMTME